MYGFHTYSRINLLDVAVAYFGFPDLATANNNRSRKIEISRLSSATFTLVHTTLS